MTRLEALIRGWESGIIIAHQICLIEESGQLILCVVEYGKVDRLQRGQGSYGKNLKEYLNDQREKRWSQRKGLQIYNLVVK